MTPKTFIALAAGVIGISSAVHAGQNSCHFPDYAICIESPTVDVGGEPCTNRGGFAGQTCPAVNRFANCIIKEESDFVFVRYYEGFSPDLAESNCAENQGEFIRD